ncbi:MAG: DUF1499 domain-containing protein [Caldilineaceae bacterium]
MLKTFLWLLLILVVVVIGGTLGLRLWARSAKRPANLGVNNGKLAPCPDTPNCVSTQATQDSQKMAALSYTGPLADAKAHLLKVVQAMPRVELLTEQDNYLAFVFRSRLIGYPDDVEFYFDDAAKQIHFRSASRLGKGDMGVNRARMEAISKAFAAQASMTPFKRIEM